MAQKFVAYFWQTRTIDCQTDPEYCYFDYLAGSPEAENVIFPFLLSPKNANARAIHNVAKIYFPDYGERNDIEKILNNCIFKLSGFGEKVGTVLLSTAPLFTIPVSSIFSHLTNGETAKYKMPYRDIEMKQLYDSFNIILTFPESIILSRHVKLGICIESIAKKNPYSQNNGEDVSEG